MKTSSFLQRKNPINPLPRNDFLKFPTNRLSPLFLFFLPHFVVTKERVEIQKCEFFIKFAACEQNGAVKSPNFPNFSGSQIAPFWWKKHKQIPWSSVVCQYMHQTSS